MYRYSEKEINSLHNKALEVNEAYDKILKISNASKLEKNQLMELLFTIQDIIR